MERILSFKSQNLQAAGVFPSDFFAAAKTFTPTTESSLRRRGKLFVVVTLKGPVTFAAGEVGEIVVDALQAEYYSLLEGSPLPALEKAVATAHHRLLDLVHGPNLAGKEGVDFNLVAAVLWGQILYLAKLGMAAVYLLRGGKLAEIGTAVETQVSVASGLVESGDVLVLGSGSFRNCFPPEILQKDLGHLEELIKRRSPSEGLIALVVSLYWEEAIAESERVQFARISGRDFPESGAGVKRFGRSLVLWLTNFLYRWKSTRRRGKPSVLAETASVPSPAVTPSAEIHPNKLPSLSERRKRRRRGLALLLLAVGFIFLFSFVFVLQRSQYQRSLREMSVLQAAVEQKILSATDFLDLNNQKAREILNEADQGIAQMLALGGSTGGENLRQRAGDLRRQLDKILAGEVKVIYDFAVQGKESRPISLLAATQAFYVADAGMGSLYRLDNTAEPVRLEQLGALEIKQIQMITGGDNNLYGLDAAGVFRVDLSKKSVMIGLAEASPAAALAYYSGNLYLLPTDGKVLTRYTPTVREVLTPLNWLKEPIDLQGAISLAVDGDVYVLFADGRVRKFTAGKVTDFKLISLDKPLTKAKEIFTQAGLEAIYVLDGGNRRVVLFDKNGFFRSQVLLTDSLFSSPTALWVSPDGRVLYLLDGTKLLSLEIKGSLW